MKRLVLRIIIILCISSVTHDALAAEENEKKNKYILIYNSRHESRFDIKTNKLPHIELETPED